MVLAAPNQLWDRQQCSTRSRNIPEHSGEKLLCGTIVLVRHRATNVLRYFLVIFVVAFVCFPGAFFSAATVRFSQVCCAGMPGVQESNLLRCLPPSGTQTTCSQDRPLPLHPHTPSTHLCALFRLLPPVHVATVPGLAAPYGTALAEGGPWVLGWSAGESRQGV